MPEVRRIKALIVDDDPDDRRLLAEAMQETRCKYELVMLNDGQDLLDYLGLPELTDRTEQLPVIVILDLNMPRMNGFETMKVMKSDRRLKTIPVIVMSTSRSQKDILESYRLGAASFIAKPISFVRLVEAIDSFSRYWAELVELPDLPCRT